jgi:hypothetical protein
VWLNTFLIVFFHFSASVDHRGFETPAILVPAKALATGVSTHQPLNNLQLEMKVFKMRELCECNMNRVATLTRFIF